MPVRKFRSIEEMDGNNWRESGDPELFRTMRSVWELARRTLRPSFPPGLYKHRSAEEADALRAAWEDENFRTFQQRRESRLTR